MKLKLKVNVGRVYGMKVYLHASFGILLAYYLWDLSWDSVVIGGIVVASMLMHELAHAGVARLFGNRPIRMTFHGFGACVRMRRAFGNTWRDALIVFAGPASNLLVAAVSWYCRELSRAWFYDGTHCICSIFCYCAAVNGMLGALNLLPAYPLDGGRLFRWIASCLMKERNAAVAVLCAGIASAIAYVAWGVAGGSIVDICVTLLVALVVVASCWVDYMVGVKVS